MPKTWAEAEHVPRHLWVRMFGIIAAHSHSTGSNGAGLQASLYAFLKRMTTQRHTEGFTLAEVVVSIAVFASAMAGVIYGYVQANYRAERSSMSLSAQALAEQSVEQALAAKWDVHAQTPGTGPGTSDELPPTNYVQVFSNALLVPSTGQSINVTNYVSISEAYSDPSVRQVRADCVWRAPFSGKWSSNTVITYRTSDQ